MFTGFTEARYPSDDLMSSRFVWAHLWWPLLGMCLLIAVWTLVQGDLWLADRVYAWEGSRWALKHAFLTEDMIHVVGRNLSAAAWVSVFACFVIARYRSAWTHLRKPLGYLLLATLAGSLLVAWAKSWSNVDCPWDLLRYGGGRPHVDLFSLRPVGLSRGVCFPAGHASGGYAWFALYFYFLAVRPRWRWYGFATGLVLGLTFGIAQQLRGAHFLSHDLWTATICWVAAAAMSLAFWPRGYKRDFDAARASAHGGDVVNSIANTRRLAHVKGVDWSWAVYRPELGIEELALSASMYFAVFSNTAFFRAVAATGALHGTGGWLLAASLFVAIAALHMLLLCMLLNRWTAKPVLIALLLVTAGAAHYMSRYTVYFDADMVRNILHTDAKESGELLTSGFIGSIAIYGLLPAILVWRTRIRLRRFKRALLIRSLCVLAAIIVSAGAMMVSFQNLSSLMRNHKELRYLVAPGNYLVSSIQVASDDGVVRDTPRIPVGTDARAAARPPDARPRLLVLVVGETVRAQNWGLNGYARQTTPELQRIGPVNFRDVTACGSSTEISLPCMFSPYGRADYDKDRIRRSESLLHVLERAGIKTVWRDNQSGCKGVCDGLEFESFDHDDDPAFCDSERCLDEVMLKGLADVARRRPGDAVRDMAAGDRVIVLHQLGNHGPSYYRRYPQRLRRFTPDCRTSELGACGRDEIVNAYDNAVLYTDEFLARTIRLLSEDPSRDTAMIYVSDHGESLGEGGLYLHGVPYAIAPETQVKVPMVMWLSPGFASDRGIDMRCMRKNADTPVSHDNLFHSVLGLMQVSTRAYDRRRDLFAGCVISAR